MQPIHNNQGHNYCGSNCNTNRRPASPSFEYLSVKLRCFDATQVACTYKEGTKMSDAPADSTASDFFRKKNKKKKKKLGFNASAESDEQQADDIVHRIVNQLSIKATEALKEAVADCAGCNRRMTALTALRDLAFAFGSDEEGRWPSNEASLTVILDFIHTIRDEIDRYPKRAAMVSCWRNLGVVSVKPGKGKAYKAKEQYTWNLGQVEVVLSYLTFVIPEGDVQVTTPPRNPRQRDDILPERFVCKIPRIVEVVAVAGKEQGASVSEILRKAEVRLVEAENPGPMLRAIPELTCRRKNGRWRYFLANEDGYEDPILATYMSQGEGSAETLQVLLNLTILCEDRQFPSDQSIKFALTFCNCDVAKQHKVVACWQRLNVLENKQNPLHWKKGRIKVLENKQNPLHWKKGRIKSLLSSSLVTDHLDKEAAINTILRNLPILNESSFANLI